MIKENPRGIEKQQFQNQYKVVSQCVALNRNNRHIISRDGYDQKLFKHVEKSREYRLTIQGEEEEINKFPTKKTKKKRNGEE